MDIQVPANLVLEKVLEIVTTNKKKKNKENLVFSPAQKVNKCDSHVFL